MKPHFSITLSCLLLAVSGLVSFPAPAPAEPANPNELVKSLSTYDIGGNRTDILALEDYLRSQSPSGRAKLETQLLPLLENSSVPYGAKDQICRWLVWTGSARSVPTLEKLSSNPKLGNSAVYALMDIPGEESGKALLHLLDQAPPELQSAIIGALGRRHDNAATAKLSALAGSSNESVAAAALTGLGAIGSSDALQALQNLKANPAVVTVRHEALINGAFRLLKTGSNKSLALSVFNTVLTQSENPTLQIGALEGLISVQGADALPALLPLLQNQNPKVRLGAARLTASIPGTETGSKLAGLLEKLDADVQAVIVLSFANGKNPSALMLAQKSLTSSNPSVRLAAVNALGLVGDDSTVAALLPLLAEKGDLATAATESLGKLPGSGVTRALRKVLPTQQGAARACLIKVLGDRLDRDSFESFLSATADSDPAIRTAAFSSIGRTSHPDDLAKLLTLIPNAKTAQDQKGLSSALSLAARSNPNQNEAAALLEKELPAAQPAIRDLLIITLANMECEKASSALEKLLNNPDVDARKDVIRTLSGAKTPSTTRMLLQAAQKAQDPTERILALRGYLDGLDAQQNKKPVDYKNVWPLASRQEEKDAILASLKKMHGPVAEGILKELAPQPNTQTPNKP